MDALTTAAAGGIQSRMEALDMLANNLANTSSSGFKADREFYTTYMAPELGSEANPIVGETPLVQQHWTDFSQGNLVKSGNETDLALSGSGFFAVNGPNSTLYTRNGNFHVTSQGVLATAEGYPVRLSSGEIVQTQPGEAIVVGKDGQVSQGANVIGKLAIVDFKDPHQLGKAGSTYFATSDPKAGPDGTATAEVYQGSAETSNAAPAESAARMVTLLRSFEMLQNAIKIGTEMNRHAVEDVARVSA
ncbi:MAG: flagellar hook-basal body protein [Bryobacteraceae bacterium]